MKDNRTNQIEVNRTNQIEVNRTNQIEVNRTNQIEDQNNEMQSNHNEINKRQSVHKLINLKPMEIEQKSFEMITEELKGRIIKPEHELVVKRVIHTSADFEYVENLCFSEDVVKYCLEELEKGCDIVTDTQMAKAGINKTILAELGGEVFCFIADDDVAIKAKELGVTRSKISMEKAAKLPKKCIFAIGNAPTALIELDRLIKAKTINPIAIIGVPVGFVNVVESKELIMAAGVPYIVAKGRKGGSNVAAAICNALIYQIKR